MNNDFWKYGISTDLCRVTTNLYHIRQNTEQNINENNTMISTKPGINNKPFIIEIDSKYLKREDIIYISEENQLELLTNPRKKWYQVLFQIISIGFYKAPNVYRVKVRTKQIK